VGRETIGAESSSKKSKKKKNRAIEPTKKGIQAKDKGQSCMDDKACCLLF
jgi:hypothetical protein